MWFVLVVYTCYIVFCVFFFKQKTAYEMRISDWSSDVCSSDLTIEAVRRAIQHSEKSLRALAKRYGINQKTVAKWKKRTAVKDLPTGPKDVHSTVLSIEEEAIIVAFRKHTLLPLDDCLYALQATIPPLTRSSLHRCLPIGRASGRERVCTYV